MKTFYSKKNVSYIFKVISTRGVIEYLLYPFLGPIKVLINKE